MDTAHDVEKAGRCSCRAPVLIDDYEEQLPDPLRFRGQAALGNSPSPLDASGFSSLFTVEHERALDTVECPYSRQLGVSSDASQSDDGTASMSTFFPVLLTRGHIQPWQPPRSRSPASEPSQPAIPPELIRPHQYGTIFFNPPLHTPPMPKGMHIAVRKAINSHNTESLIQLLCSHPPVVKQMIPEFRAMYKETPAQALSRKWCLERKFRKLMIGCAMDTLAYSTKCLMDAFNGFTVNKEILIDLLAGGTLYDIRALKVNYIRVTNRSLDADVTRRLMGGPFSQLCYSLINIERRSSCRETDTKTDATTIYRVNKKVFGTNRGMLIDILVNRTDVQLRELFRTYKLYYKTNIERVIVSEFHGYTSTTLALLALVSGAKDRIAHVADMLNDALVANNSSKLIRLVLLYREREICRKVKMVYQRRYFITLAQAISMKTSGAFKDALLACIGEGK